MLLRLEKVGVPSDAFTSVGFYSFSVFSRYNVNFFEVSVYHTMDPLSSDGSPELHWQRSPMDILQLAQKLNTRFSLLVNIPRKAWPIVSGPNSHRLGGAV